MTTPNNYWTSDPHFLHNNIIRYCDRPFANLDDMHHALITNWNNTVAPDDNIYIIGDVSFGKPEPTNEILSQLNGNKFLVRGNHDTHIERHSGKHFKWIKDYAEMYVVDETLDSGKQLIIMLHYAMKVWNRAHYGSWQLYGHSHGGLPDDPNSKSMDVGMDANNYTPISYQQIKEIMATKKYVALDHHKEGSR